MSNVIRSLTVKVGADLTSFEKNMSRMGRTLQKKGQQISNLGSTLSRTLTLPILAAGVASAKMASDYEESLAKVGTIADNTKISMEEISDRILDLSDKTGFAATELNEALYQAISAGVDTADAIGLIEVAAKSAKAGFTDTETAIDGLTSVMNAYGMSATEADRLANLFLITQNKGKTTFGELAQSIGNVSSISATAGLKIEDLLASIATLTANGIKTDEAVTGIKSALSNIIKPSTEASKVAKELGLDFSVTALKTKGLASFLEDVKEKTGGNIETMGKLFGNVRALNSVMALTSDEGMAFMNDALNEMGSNTTALDDAFKTMESTSKASWTKLWNNVKNVAIEFGNKLLPAVNKFMENFVKPFIEKVKAMDDKKIERIIKNLLLLATLGPALSIVGRLTTGMGNLMSAVSRASKAFTAGKGLIGALTAFAGPTGIALAVVAGLALIVAGAMKLADYLSQSAVPAVNDFGENVDEGTTEAINSFLKLNDEATIALNELKWSGTTLTKETANNIISAFANLANSVKAAMEKSFQESYKTISSYFTKSEALSKEEEANVLQEMTKNEQEKIKIVDESQKRINEILTKASKEKRQLTESEYEEISTIQTKLKDFEIDAVSQSMTEQLALYEALKTGATAKSAETAAAVVKTSIETRDKTIKAAKDQYDTIIKEAYNLYEAGDINEDQYRRIIQDAQKSRDDTIQAATDMHNGIVEQAKLASGEFVDAIDWDNGVILTKFEKLKKDSQREFDVWMGNVQTSWNKTMNSLEAAATLKVTVKAGGGGGINAYASGTKSALKGLAITGEEGAELIDFRGGERVYNAKETQSILNGVSGVNITGNTFIVRQESDIDKIATALHNKIQINKRGAVLV